MSRHLRHPFPSVFRPSSPTTVPQPPVRAQRNFCGLRSGVMRF